MTAGPGFTPDWTNELNVKPPSSAGDERMPEHRRTPRRDLRSPAIGYLAISGDGLPARGFYPEQRDRAHEYARNTGGMVLNLPVDGDYRPQEGGERG